MVSVSTLKEEDLTTSGDLLQLLIEEVAGQESVMGGDEGGFRSIGQGTTALQQLKQTNISFGNPYDNLQRLTATLFDEIGIQLSPIQKQQMERSFDFYFMTLAVSMQPSPGVQFSRLECRLDLGPKGENEPIVQSIFPKSEWREILRLGRKLNLGLDAGLEWKAQLDASPAELKAQINQKTEISTYLAIPQYSYALGTADITATGEGNSFCFWRIDKPALKEAQTVRFALLFKVPKGSKTLELSGIASVEPDFQWLTSKLEDVFDFLSDRLKNLLRKKDSEREGQERLPNGTWKKWELTLPQE